MLSAHPSADEVIAQPLLDDIYWDTDWPDRAGAVGATGGEPAANVRFALYKGVIEERSDFEPGQQTSRRYGECAYQAGSWPRERRVIVKAEVTAHFGRQPKDNPRFVVTNLKTTPRYVYEAVYCARGDVENRLKELKLGLEIDRTSCTSFLANQLRVLMSAAAYVLMQELRLKARRTGCARAQVSTLRLRLLKLGAWIESSVRRIVNPLADRHAVRRRLAPHRTLGWCCCDLIR